MHSIAIREGIRACYSFLFKFLLLNCPEKAEVNLVWYFLLGSLGAFCFRFRCLDIIATGQWSVSRVMMGIALASIVFLLWSNCVKVVSL